MMINKEIQNYFEAGQYSKVRQICQNLIKDENTFRLIALCYQKENDNENAIKYYQKALKRNKNHLLSLQEIGMIYSMTDRQKDAEQFLKKAITISSDVITLSNLGICLAKQEKYHDSYKYFLKAYQIEKNPHTRGNLINLCKVFGSTGDLDTSLKIAIEVNDTYSMTHIAQLYEGNKEYLKARQIYDLLLKQSPNDYHILNFYGSNWLNDNNLKAAEEYFNKASLIEPNDPYVVCNLGLIQQYNGNYDVALELYKKSVDIGNTSEVVFCNIGSLLAQLGNIEESIVYFNKALEINPKNKEALFNNALSTLSLGNLESGFELYEYRPTKFQLPSKEWKGETGVTLLLLAEQGMGDTLQFGRYIPLLQKLDLKIVFVCQKPLAPLFSQLGIEIIEAYDGIKLENIPYDYYYVHLMSLPRIFKTNLLNIPSSSYLRPDENKVEHWKEKLSKYNGLKVGICWAGNPRRHLLAMNTVDKRRSITLEKFSPLFDLPITLFSLQKDDDLNQIENHQNVVNYMSDITDFADTAALIENLDMVITVDTSVAHLVGILQKPCLLLSRYDSCWRWLKDRSDSPWYPSIKIFRQPILGDWESVVDEVVRFLKLTYFSEPS